MTNRPEVDKQWSLQLVSTAIFLVLVFTAVESTSFAAESWSRLYAGQLAVLSGGGPFDPVKLCETSAEVDAFNANLGPPCQIRVPYGSHVRIISMIIRGTIAENVNADVEVESVTGKWSGWVSCFWIMPVIPAGTILSLDPIGRGDDEAPFFRKLVSDGSPAFSIPHGRKAQVLSQLGRVCKIRVLSGSRQGQVGFTDCSQFGTTNLAPGGIKFVQ